MSIQIHNFPWHRGRCVLMAFARCQDSRIIPNIFFKSVYHTFDIFSSFALFFPAIIFMWFTEPKMQQQSVGWCVKWETVLFFFTQKQCFEPVFQSRNKKEENNNIHIRFSLNFSIHRFVLLFFVTQIYVCLPLKVSRREKKKSVYER